MLSCYDGGKTLLGKVSVPVSDLDQNHTDDRWIPFHAASLSSKHSSPAGEIHLLFDTRRQDASYTSASIVRSPSPGFTSKNMTGLSTIPLLPPAHFLGESESNGNYSRHARISQSIARSNSPTGRILLPDLTSNTVLSEDSSEGSLSPSPEVEEKSGVEVRNTFSTTKVDIARRISALPSLVIPPSPDHGPAPTPPPTRNVLVAGSVDGTCTAVPVSQVFVTPPTPVTNERSPNADRASPFGYAGHWSRHVPEPHPCDFIDSDSIVSDDYSPPRVHRKAATPNTSPTHVYADLRRNGVKISYPDRCKLYEESPASLRYQVEPSVFHRKPDADLSPPYNTYPALPSYQRCNPVCHRDSLEYVPSGRPPQPHYWGLPQDTTGWVTAPPSPYTTYIPSLQSSPHNLSRQSSINIPPTTWVRAPPQPFYYR